MTIGKRGNGEGSISHRPDGRWQGSITLGRDDNGKLIRKYFYGKTRKEVANKINAAIEINNRKSYILRNSNPTLGQWANIWLWDYKRNSVKPTTFDQYESIMRVHIIPNLGEIKLIDLQTEHIQKLINKMHEAGLSGRTIEIMRVILHGMLKQAHRNKLVYENVCEYVVLPKKSTRDIRVLTVEEQEKLIDVLRRNYIGRALLFELYTGMRKSEVLPLTWDDFDEKAGTISVSKKLSRVRTYVDKGKRTMLAVDTPKTEKSIRVIPLVNSAYELLLEHRREQEKYKAIVGDFYTDKNLIFSSNAGTYMDPGNFNRKLTKCAVEAGIPHVYPHALRHSFATRGFEADISLKGMQVLLGHSSISVTSNVYTHILYDQKKKEIEKLNNIF